MAFLATATVDPGAAGTVRLDVSGGTPPYRAEASPGGDRPDYRVRDSWADMPGVPSGRIGVDGAAPLNVPVQYVVTDATGAQVTTSAVTVTSSVSILSDATDPGAFLPVRVVSQKPNSWQARSVWWDILGSPAPFASVAPMRYRSGPLALRIETVTERAALLTLLRPGNPLMFRGACPPTVDDLTILVETAEESLILDNRPEGPYLWTLDYQAITVDLGPYDVDSARSYDTVKAAVSAYDTLYATYATYDAVRTGTPRT